MSQDSVDPSIVEAEALPPRLDVDGGVIGEERIVWSAEWNA